MSIPLPQVNLTGVTVGQTGTISFANTGISAGGISANPVGIPGAGTLHIFNESGSGLEMTFQTSGDGFFLPAGGWTDKVVKAGEQGLIWQVLYNLPSPPVSLLLVTFYRPGEPVSNIPVLGNSPIGGMTTVASGGTIFFITPVNFINNGSLNNSTIVVTATNVGGIPASATAVLCNLYYTSATTGAFVSITPHGIVWTTTANYPIVGTTQVANIAMGGSFIVPVDVAGKLDVTSLSNCTGVYMSAYGYIQ